MINSETYRSRRLELYEVLELVEKAETSEDKKLVLRKHNSTSLRDYLQCLFDDNVKFLLPEGKPPYVACKEESVPSTWHKRHRDLRYIVKGLAADKVKPFKRESIFIGILESVHPKDAEILADMICKNPPFESLTKEIVKEAFPSLLLN